MGLRLHQCKAGTSLLFHITVTLNIPHIACKVLPTNDYTPGAVLPPHLSPFVEETEDEYMPPERKAQLAQAKGIHEVCLLPLAAIASDACFQEDLNAEELEGDEDFEALDDDELYQQELEAELNREDTCVKLLLISLTIFLTNCEGNAMLQKQWMRRTMSLQPRARRSSV